MRHRIAQLRLRVAIGTVPHLPAHCRSPTSSSRMPSSPLPGAAPTRQPHCASRGGILSRIFFFHRHRMDVVSALRLKIRKFNYAPTISWTPGIPSGRCVRRYPGRTICAWPTGRAIRAAVCSMATSTLSLINTSPASRHCMRVRAYLTAVPWALKCAKGIRIPADGPCSTPGAK